MKHLINPSQQVTDILATLALGLGLHITGAEFAGGLVMAFFGSMIALKMQPARRAKSYWFAVLAGLFVAVLAAQFAGGAWLVEYTKNIPIAGIMGIAGFGSSWLLRTFMNIGNRAEKNLPGRIFPKDEE